MDSNTIMTGVGLLVALTQSFVLYIVADIKADVREIRATVGLDERREKNRRTEH